MNASSRLVERRRVLHYNARMRLYYAIVFSLMFLLPAACAGLEWRATEGIASALIQKWFVFWAVGVRLLLAGSRQIVQPGYTARQILGLRGNEALLVVRELGFANVALSIVAAGSLVVPGWRVAGALAGAVFYGLAGTNHAGHAGRNRAQTVAMVSDLFVALVLGGALWAA